MAGRVRNPGYCEGCGARVRVLQRHHFAEGGARSIWLCVDCLARYAAIAAAREADDRRAPATEAEPEGFFREGPWWDKRRT